MAEILVLLRSCDPDKDPLTSWTRLYPVVVKPDGWAWGNMERPPKFLVVRITDMTVAQAEAYLEKDEDVTDPDHPIILAIRKWKIDIDDVNIPKPIQNKINAAISNGTILQVTTGQISAFIKRTR